MLWSHLFWTMRVAFDAWQGTNRGNGNWRRQDKIRRGTCRSNSRKCIVNVLMFTCLLLVQCSLLCDADGPIKHISILRPKHLDEFGKALWYLAALLAGCPKNFNECPSVQMQIIHVEHCWALSIEHNFYGFETVPGCANVLKSCKLWCIQQFHPPTCGEETGSFRNQFQSAAPDACG